MSQVTSCIVFLPFLCLTRILAPISCFLHHFCFHHKRTNFLLLLMPVIPFLFSITGSNVCCHSSTAASGLCATRLCATCSVCILSLMYHPSTVQQYGAISSKAHKKETPYRLLDALYRPLRMASMLLRKLGVRAIEYPSDVRVHFHVGSSTHSL